MAKVVDVCGCALLRAEVLIAKGEIMKLQPGKIVCFVHGEYSDFCVDAHAVVLREFDPRKIMSEVDHVGEYNDLWEFPEAYVKSLADSGYIRVLKDEEEVFEIYIER